MCVCVCVCVCVCACMFGEEVKDTQRWKYQATFFSYDTLKKIITHTCRSMDTGYKL